MAIVCGVDPGINGALALLDADACTVEIFDMPTHEFETTKRRVKIDCHGISRVLSKEGLIHVYLEEVYSSPQMGVVSAFNFGEGKGMIEGVCAALGLPLTQIKPAKWKKDMNVPADKKAAVMRASQLIPGAAPLFKGPRGGVYDGRAEAAILALYAALELNMTITKPVRIVDA